MTTPGQRQTLARDLSMPILAPLIQRKGLFRKRPYLNLLSALFSGVEVFQQAAVLGYAKNDQMEILAKLFALPGKERESCDHLIEATKENVKGYGHPPDSFIDFFTKTVGAGLFESYTDPDTLRQLGSQEVRLGQVLEWMDTWFLAGMGLGLAFPELVESMWRNSYVTRPEDWERLHSAGLDIPEQFEALPLEEMEQVVLSQVAEYAREYVPEVIEPLRLPDGEPNER